MKALTRFLAAGLILTAASICLGQPRDADLLAVQKNGKFGFIDRTGKVVIRFQFDHAYEFYQGLARVELKQKTYFIDTTGRLLFAAPYDIIHDFHEGLSAVNIGQKTIPNLGLISEPGKWGYIDRNGKLVIPMKFTRAEDFSEGLAAVKIGERGAFIDHDARAMFEVPLDATLGFHEGIAGVLYKGLLAYYDRTGKKISPPLGYGPSSHSFSEGLVPVGINGKTGFMDRTGKIVIAPQFEDAENFSEGLAPVKVRSDDTTWCPREASGSRKGFTMKWGYIDKSGKIVIPPQFESAEPFSEGVAAINQCDEGFFVDKTGKKIVLGNFSYVSPFGAGVSRINTGVNEDRMWGLIDKTGKIIWGPNKGW